MGRAPLSDDTSGVGLRAARNFLLVLLGVLSLGALDASGALAAKMKVHPRHGKGHEEELEEGAVVLASRNLAFTTAAGAFQCTLGELSGRLAGYEGTKAIALQAVEVIAIGESGPDSACASSFAQGPAVVSVSRLPWAGELTARGAFDLKGKIGFQVSFPDDPGVQCVYAAKKLKSTYTAGVPGKPAPIEVTTASQKLTRSKHASSPACPKSGRLSASWETNLEGEIEP